MNHKNKQTKRFPLHSWKQSQIWVSVFQGEGPAGEEGQVSASFSPWVEALSQFKSQFLIILGIQNKEDCKEKERKIVAVLFRVI